MVQNILKSSDVYTKIGQISFDEHTIIDQNMIDSSPNKHIKLWTKCNKELTR